MNIYLKNEVNHSKLHEGSRESLEPQFEQRGIVIHETANIGLCAHVHNKVRLGACSHIGDNSIVGYNSRIGSDTFLSEYGSVAENVRIAGDVHIGTNSRIGMKSCIGRSVIIGNDVTIGKRCKIGNDVVIADNAYIEDGTTINNTSDCITIGPIGSRHATLTAHRSEYGIWVATGCFTGLLTVFAKQVRTVHGNNHYGLQYRKAISYIKEALTRLQWLKRCLAAYEQGFRSYYIGENVERALQNQMTRMRAEIASEEGVNN